MITNLILLISMLIPGMDSVLDGAWMLEKNDGNTEVIVFASGYFSQTAYAAGDSPSFGKTVGGVWSTTDKGKVTMSYEYHTADSTMVGTQKELKFSIKGEYLKLGKTIFTRIDNGTPGELAGAWLITGRMRNGEMRERTPGARKTMKILSGTRFQWIAYNTETGVFSGTGGGTYTTIDGKYTENIEFFSRDNSRVGASLEFDYALEDAKWHHSGLSSKGSPIHEVWTLRSELEE